MREAPGAHPQKQPVNSVFLVQSKDRKMARTTDHSATSAITRTMIASAAIITDVSMR